MKKIVILIMALGLAGCELGDRENKRAIGTLTGLVVGGTVGYITTGGAFWDKFIFASLYGAGGAAAGYYLAERLLPPDREKLDSTAYKVLDSGETGEAVAWGEKGKGAWGTFTPTRDYIAEDGSTCRDYVAIINFDGESGTVEETACRLGDRGWQTRAI